MFFIEEQTKGTIVFAGKVENPLHLDTISSRGVNPGDQESKKVEEKVAPRSNEKEAESTPCAPQTKVTFTGRGFQLTTT